jgi:lysophospholipase L1-like esterase
MPNLRKTATQIAILIIINFIIIICLEYFSRVILANFFIPQYTYAPEYADFNTYQKIIGPFAPNQKVILKFHIPYKVSINSMGLRGREFSINKPPGVYRLLCLGDSITFGFGINSEEQVFTSILEDELNNMGTSKKFEVINGGIGGTTISDQYAFLQKKCLKINPDLVILTFCRNDVDELANTSAFEEIETYVAQKRGTFAIIEKTNTYKLMANVYRLMVVLNKALRKRLSAKWGAWYKKISRLLARKQNNYAADNIRAAKQRIEERKQRRKLLWAKYKDYLSKMKSVLKQKDIKFVLAVVLFDNPLLKDREAKNAQINSTLQQYAEELDIPMINYSSVFNHKVQEENLTFAPVDPHPSAYGHKMMAQSLKNFLINNGIISEQ